MYRVIRNTYIKQIMDAYGLVWTGESKNKDENFLTFSETSPGTIEIGIVNRKSGKRLATCKMSRQWFTKRFCEILDYRDKSVKTKKDLPKKEEIALDLVRILAAMPLLFLNK